MLFLRWLCGGVTRGVLMSALKLIGSPGGQSERLRGRGGAKWLCFTFFTLNASPPVLYFISNLYVGVLWLTVPNWFLLDCTVRKEHLDLVQRSMLTHDIWCFCPLLEYSIRWENCSIKKHCSTFARPYVVRVVFYSGIKNQNTAYLNKYQLASIAHFSFVFWLYIQVGLHNMRFANPFCCILSQRGPKKHCLFLGTVFGFFYGL